MKTRVRFAPSPTGPLHIGGVRTALFSYLFAQINKGVFVLRIEDTDQARYVNGSEEYIQKTLEWCGLTPDEGPNNGGIYGPYRQSQRKEIYRVHMEKLIENGSAYYAFDETEALNDERKKAEINGETFRYGALNRLNFKNSLTLRNEDVKEKLKDDYVVRLKVNPGEIISVYDEIRGNITLNSDLLDDKILIKSDGMPTYHFANVVDDKLMEISCVIRGEEWLPSLPIHKLIYNAFGWKTPQFMHLPLILKPKGKGKLSKRDGDKGGFPVFPLSWGASSVGFMESGFLPEGFINYLALLGWNNGTEKEIFSLDELKQSFSISGIQKGSARFDFEKAKWINHQHLRRCNPKKLVNMPIVKEGLKVLDPSKHIALINLLKERLITLNDLHAEMYWINETQPYDEKVMHKLKSKNAERILKGILNIVGDCNEMETLKDLLIIWAEKNEINIGVMMQCFRVALVGRLSGPHLFEICKFLNKDIILIRISKAISYFQQKT